MSSSSLMFATSILLISVILLIVYSYSFDHRVLIKGVWAGTKQFCSESSITNMVLYMRDDYSGKLVIMNDDKIITDQEIRVIGLDSPVKKLSQPFKENVKIELSKDKEIMPSNVTLKLNDNRLSLEGKDIQYADMYKLSS